MPEHDTQAHENNHAPEGKEDREHETLLPKGLCIRIDQSHDQSLVVVPATTNCGGCNGL